MKQSIKWVQTYQNAIFTFIINMKQKKTISIFFKNHVSVTCNKKIKESKLHTIGNNQIWNNKKTANICLYDN